MPFVEMCQQLTDIVGTVANEIAIALWCIGIATVRIAFKEPQRHQCIKEVTRRARVNPGPRGERLQVQGTAGELRQHVQFHRGKQRLCAPHW
jgi:hypothetical protein